MKQFNLFFHALQFYTRIPVGKINFSEDDLTQSLRYFPLVGAIAGGIGGIIFWLSMFVFPQAISAIFALLAMVAATGALHEDGVADFFDAFGGGYTKERILAIMKDSHVGAYGVITLIFLFLIKFSCFYSIDARQLPIVLIAAHASSRFMAVLLIKTSTYARPENSKSAHSRNPMLQTTFITAFALATIPLIFIHWIVIIGVVIVYALIFIALKRYVEKKIDGFTGDVLGTLQQFCEIAFYLCFLAATTLNF
jgi:adenosylcobinamide-GDP ribazoletransferase